jgi:DHA3 family multidrug efflux protein-like MFS transporter
MSEADGSPADVPGLRRVFHHVLANTLVVSVMDFTVWFAVTFFVYLETRSVFATGIIAGIFLTFTALFGLWFGSLVDHHRKKTVMVAATGVSLVFYAVSLAIYLLAGRDEFSDPASGTLWVFVLLLMAGVITGNIRGIALSTVVTLLIPQEARDKANGLVGTASGVSFLITSVISGVLVGLAGMLYVLLLAIAVMAIAIAHLLTVRLPHDRVAAAGEHGRRGGVDVRGTLAVVSGISGLLALIAFTAINNLLGGVFMALMDAYGLSLVSVEVWGLLWGLLSTGFIIGGLVVARWGLGRNPLRSFLLGNVVLWSLCALMFLRSSIVLLSIGIFLYMLVMPYIEASEQTVLQRVVPYERQGRVFGFAQSVEQSASPLTAFLISPLAQFVFIPFMTDGAGVDLIGGWFGSGADRGIALVFTVTGAIGLVLTVLAMRSRQYRQLSERYLERETAAP